jgi:chromatin remodeling complex protein RSC6
MAKTKSSTSKKTAESPVTVDTPLQAEDVSTVVECSVPEEIVVKSNSEESTSEESNTEILFNKLINQFQDIQSVMKTLHSNLKVLQKEVLRERKESKKKESKIKKKSDKKRKPSGFAVPAPISNELANFLGLQNGDLLARTEVTTKVIEYVKQQNLQNPENKKQIVPDAKLKDLLQSADSDVITFFNLQTYLKKHFLQATTDTQTNVTVL